MNSKPRTGAERRIQRFPPALVLMLMLFRYPGIAEVPEPLLRPGDVLAWLGGAQVVSAQRSGFPETMVAVARPEWRLRWRSLAWEGDTVFSRPRELNFPSIPKQLRETGATVTALQFGTMESLAGPAGVSSFVAAYGQLLDEIGQVTPRRILIIPPAAAWASDRTNRHGTFTPYARAIRDLGRARGLPVVDLYTPMAGEATIAPMTDIAVARLLAAGLAGLPLGSGNPPPDEAHDLTRPEVEALRQAVVARNRLWFDYSRPMNWAFLGGDRTDQPSSRDHHDRNLRWFPAEMERFVPLIAEGDQRIWSLSLAARKEVR